MDDKESEDMLIEGPKPLSIHETSKATGLSPSVLRIWELRYGWPTPRRRGNGYRTYPMALVDDLRRASNLVRSGMPIGQLIIDGFPKWPADLAKPVASRMLPQSRALLASARGEAARIKAQLVEAFEQGKHTEVRGILQRAPFQLRPSEEVQAVLAPAVVAIAELRAADRWTDDTEHQGVLADLAVRTAAMSRGGSGTVVVAATDADLIAARVVCLLLRSRGQNASVAAACGAAGIPASGAWVSVSDDEPLDGAKTHYGILGKGGIADLLGPAPRGSAAA